MAAKKWIGGSDSRWVDPRSWESTNPRLTTWEKFRLWLAEKIVGKKFNVNITPAWPPKGVEPTGKGQVVFNGLIR